MVFISSLHFLPKMVVNRCFHTSTIADSLTSGHDFLSHWDAQARGPFSQQDYDAVKHRPGWRPQEIGPWEAETGTFDRTCGSKAQEADG